MKQRVALVRSLIMEPDILLMDEPFAAVDAQTRTVLQQELLELWERTATTVLFVTHSVEEALLLSDRVYVLSSRPARVREVVDVELPRPRDLEAILALPAYGALHRRVSALLRTTGACSARPGARAVGARAAAGWVRAQSVPPFSDVVREAGAVLGRPEFLEALGASAGRWRASGSRSRSRSASRSAR